MFKRIASFLVLTQLFSLVVIPTVNAATTPPVTPCVNGASYASAIETVSQGTLNDGSAVTDPNRMDPSAMLGAPDGNFFAIGKGGTTTLSFTGYVMDVPGEDLSFHEITNGRDTYPKELGKVEVSQNGTIWKNIGQANGFLNNGVTLLDFSSTGFSWVRFVRFSDANDWSEHSDTADGYDLDAVDATLEVCANINLKKTGEYTSSTNSIEFTIDWSVIGTGDATEVIISDVIGAGTTYAAASASAPGLFDGTDTITWDLGTKNAGDSGSVTFEVTVNAALGGQWAAHIVSASQGTNKDGSNILSDRIDPTKALGPAQSSGAIYDNPLTPLQGEFYSLGFTGSPTTGGNVVVTFDQPVINGPGNDLKVYEITSGDIYPDEKVKVEVSNDGSTWNNLGIVVRDGEADLGANTSANFVRVTDNSIKADYQDDADGYDLDAIKVLHVLPNECEVENIAKVSWKSGTQALNTTASTTVSINESACNSGSYTISGQKWQDTDGDATKNGSEAGVTGFVVYIDANTNGNKDAGEIFATTDASGNYTLSGVVPGIYEIHEVSQAGWTQTYPTAGAFGKHVVVVINANVSDKNFGNKQVSGGSGNGGGNPSPAPTPAPTGGSGGFPATLNPPGGNGGSGSGAPNGTSNPGNNGQVLGTSTDVPSGSGLQMPVEPTSTPQVLGAVTELPRTGNSIPKYTYFLALGALLVIGALWKRKTA